ALLAPCSALSFRGVAGDEELCSIARFSRDESWLVGWNLADSRVLLRSPASPACAGKRGMTRCGAASRDGAAGDADLKGGATLSSPSGSISRICSSVSANRSCDVLVPFAGVVAVLC